MKTEELKPCPFCGGEAKRFAYHSCDEVRYMTYCGKSKTSTDFCTGSNTSSMESQESADKYWNKRA